MFFLLLDLDVLILLNIDDLLLGIVRLLLVFRQQIRLTNFLVLFCGFFLCFTRLLSVFRLTTWICLLRRTIFPIDWVGDFLFLLFDRFLWLRLFRLRHWLGLRHGLRLWLWLGVSWHIDNFRVRRRNIKCPELHCEAKEWVSLGSRLNNVHVHVNDVVFSGVLEPIACEVVHCDWVICIEERRPIVQLDVHIGLAGNLNVPKVPHLFCVE